VFHVQKQIDEEFMSNKKGKKMRIKQAIENRERSKGTNNEMKQR
jgi:hypothetical protein